MGFGHDTHRLVTGRKLILGGVQLPSRKGLLGHSDADVLLHAVSDALLGAAGLGDIGELFPDTEPSNRDMNSRIILEKAHALIQGKSYRIINLDCIIFAEDIRISPFKERIRESLSRILSLEKADVNIKAKTGEGLDAVGRGEAVAACCIALLQPV